MSPAKPPTAPSRKPRPKRPFRRLLLVEDNDLIAEGLASLLKLEGLTVLVIGHGLLVVDAVDNFEPDAVILDLTLPDIDGLEVFRRLRKRWPHLPVVFSTGHDNLDLRTEQKDKRVELLMKPFGIDELLSALRRVTAA